MKMLIALFVLLTAAPALAHGDGASFETTIDGYFIDVGYSAPEPTSEDVVLFDFAIEREGTPVAFDDVWVRIEQDGATVFAGGIHNAPFGGARLSYRFPGTGSYTVNVRFETDQGPLAEASFPMSVAASETADTSLPYVPALVGLLLGAGLTFAFMRRTGA